MTTIRPDWLDRLLRGVSLRGAVVAVLGATGTGVSTLVDSLYSANPSRSVLITANPRDSYERLQKSSLSKQLESSHREHVGLQYAPEIIDLDSLLSHDPCSLPRLTHRSHILLDDFHLHVAHWAKYETDPEYGIYRASRRLWTALANGARETGKTVVVGHKLAGVAAEFEPHQIPTPRNAMGYRSISDHAKAAIVLGNHDECGRFAMRGFDRNAIREATTVLAKIVGGFAIHEIKDGRTVRYAETPSEVYLGGVTKVLEGLVQHNMSSEYGQRDDHRHGQGEQDADESAGDTPKARTQTPKPLTIELLETIDATEARAREEELLPQEEFKLLQFELDLAPYEEELNGTIEQLFLTS